MKLSITFFGAACLLAMAVTNLAHAETAQELEVRKIVTPRFGKESKIDSVTKTPYLGLFELRIGSDIIYTDQKAQYLFVGKILDGATLQNYTKARHDSFNKINFADLPLESALKMVRGNGKRVIAVFEDPNCSYCKRFRQTLEDVEDVTIYTFMYNILSPDSETKSRDVWCSADRNKAWDEWMLNGKPAATAAAGCTTPNEKIFALGQKLRITGTPTIFFADGTRVPGAMDRQALEARLAGSK
jgi:thiol:disulfide interchange protein DsbC